MTILRAENISKQFVSNGLEKVSFQLEKGEYLCVTGESGCGKTTFLNILSGMLRPDTGSVYLGEKELYSDMSEKKRAALRNHTIGYMMQGNVLIPELSIWQNLVAPLELAKRKAKEENVYEITDRLGISKQLDSYPSELSGGEYRRALFARILLLETEILLVDEPTSNLDENSAGIVREVLMEEHEKGKTIVLVTHDKLFEAYFSKKIQLYGCNGSTDVAGSLKKEMEES